MPLIYFSFPQPVYVTDWEMHVHFKVHGSKGALFGDGFAIWYTKDRMELGKFCPIVVNGDVN